MLENSLPLSGNTSTGANVLLQGVDPCFHSVLLHHINLKSDFVSGQVVFGVFLCYLVSIWPMTELLWSQQSPRSLVIQRMN